MTRSKLDSISEFARQGHLVRARCRNCRHTAEINPVLLMQQLHKAKRSMQVDAVERTMRCRMCHHRGAVISAAVSDW